MKAAYIEQFSPQGNIKVGEIALPELGDEEVSIKVAYAGMNPVDGKFADGRYSDYPHQFPIILGWEAAGIIVACGKKVVKWRKGDEVFVYCRKPVLQWGSWAEYLNVRAEDVALKPKNLCMAEAAAIPLAGLTAWQALFDKGRLKAEETVLIHGGAGGVGGFAIQWAKLHGAHVVTTASAAKNTYVKQLGADETIDYQNADFVKEILKKHPKGIDLVLDSMGGSTWKRSFEVLKPGGCIVSLREQPDVDLAKKFQVRAEYLFVTPNAAQLKEIAGLFEKGQAKHPHITELALEQVNEGMEEIRKGHTTGKIVLKIG